MDNSPEHIRRTVDQAKSDRRPIMNWVGRSLEEIYLSGDFGRGRYAGPAEEVVYTPSALRIVAINGADINAISIIPFGNPEKKDDHGKDDIAMARRLRAEIVKLSKTPNPRDTAVEEFVVSEMRSQNKQVLAALELGTTVEGGIEIGQVLYPKTYMRSAEDLFRKLGMPMPEDQLRIMAFGTAVSFLEKIRPSSNNPIVLGTG